MPGPRRRTPSPLRPRPGPAVEAVTLMPVVDPSLESPQQSRSLLLRGGSWNALAQLAPIFVNLALTPFIINGLGLARFGLYILAVSIADFFGSFDGGLYSAAQRYFATYVGANDRRSASLLYGSLTTGVAGFGIVLWLALTSLSSVLVELFRVPDELRSEGRFLLQILGIVLALQILRGVFAALLNANRRFAVTSIATVLQYTIYTVGIVATIKQGWGLHGVALTLLVQTATMTLLLGIASSRFIVRAEVGFLPRRELMDFLKYAGRAQVASFSDLINLQSDAVIVGGFLGVTDVALYSSGRNFASQLRSFPVNAISPAATLLGEIFGRDGEATVTKEFARLQRLWVRGIAGWIAVAAGAAWFGVTKWLGDGFELAGTVAVILLVGYLFRLCVDMLAVYCQTVGHPEYEARYGAVTVVINLTLTFAFVVPFGVVGVVVATAIAQLIGSLYLVRVVRQKVSTAVPSFLRDIPWVLMLATAALTAGLELLGRPLVTEGPLGLLQAGLLALPALLFYAICVLGPVTLLGYARKLIDRLRPGHPTR